MSNSELLQFKAEFFKALSSPVRIGILDQLRDGELTVTDLRMRLGVELTNISQQLAILKAKNILVGRKQGSNVFYSCRDPAIFDLLDAAKEIFNNHLIDVKDMLETLEPSRKAAGSTDLGGKVSQAPVPDPG